MNRYKINIDISDIFIACPLAGETTALLKGSVNPASKEFLVTSTSSQSYKFTYLLPLTLVTLIILA